MGIENYIERAAGGGRGSSSSSSNGGNVNNDYEEDDTLTSFRYAIPSKGTEKDSLTRLGYFFNFHNIPGNSLNEQASNFLAQVAANPKPKYAHDCLFKFSRRLKGRFENKELKGGTIRNYLFAPKLFYDVNDLKFDWRQIKRGLPVANYVAHDRSPTLQDIRKLITNSDRRIKVIVLIAISSGIRVGAFNYLKLKHVIPIENEKKEIIAAKLVVYEGEPDQHVSFITPEAYQAVQEYVEFRKLHGEKITGESWLLRDKFLTTTDRHAANKSLPTHPQKLEVEAIKKLIQRAWEVQGVREPLKENEHRHEFKTMHGFRKYYRTKTVAAGMDPLNVEFLMDHKTGLENNYYRPTEQMLQDDYINKAVDYLVINTEQKERNQLQKEVVELKEERKNDNYAIMGKLIEKDREIEELKTSVDKLIKTEVNMACVNDWLNENVPGRIEQLIWEYMSPDPEDGSIPCDAEEFERRKRDLPELLRAAKKLRAQRLAVTSSTDISISNTDNGNSFS
jgi:integrase